MFHSTKTLSVCALALAITIVSVTTASAAPIYNASADFSASSNPNGVWSYGIEGTSLGNPDPTTFSVYSTPRTGASIGPAYTGLSVWTTGPTATDPNVIRNLTNGVITDGTNTWQPGELTFGPAGGPSVIRFTAPAAGLYVVNATFSPSQTVNTVPNAYVYEGTTQLFDMSAATPVNYNSGAPLSLAANETIDFIAFGGLKTTQLDATITVVPEPASLVLSGLGALGLFFVVRRRRAA